MTNDELDEVEKAAGKNPLMPSAVVKRLVSALLQARWEADNYRKLAAYYKGDADVRAELGSALGVRTLAN